MKIAIATGPMLPVPAAEGGAMVRAMMDLAQAMQVAGHDLTILACQRPGQAASERLDGIKVQRRGGFMQSRLIWRDLLLDLHDAWRWRKHIPDCDVLITNDVFLPIMLQATRRRFGLLAVVARWPKAHYRLYRQVDRFAAISAPVANALAAQCPKQRDQIDLLPIGYDATCFRLLPGMERRTLTFVGRLHPEKGIHLLIEACRELGAGSPPVQIVGPWQSAQGGGGEAYFKALQRAAEGLPITFTGPIFDRQALVATLNQTRVFVYPSLAEQGEALGLAPIEAMACGAVAVTSELACFRDYLIPEQNGFCFDHRGPQPALALAKAIQQAWQAAASPSFLAAVQQAAARYQAGALAKRWLDTCATICRARSET